LREEKPDLFSHVMDRFKWIIYGKVDGWRLTVQIQSPGLFYKKIS
jgi:hypothetical protein